MVPDHGLASRDLILSARSLSDLGRIYCGDGKQVHFFDPFRYVEPLRASNDQKTVLGFPSPRYDPLSQTGS